MNYGKGIKTIREGLGMDTIDFSDLCGMTPGTIFKYEENYEDLTMKEADALCSALKIPIDFLQGLSTEVNDIPVQYRYLFSNMVGILTDLTIHYIRAENLEGVELDLKWIKSQMIELEIMKRKGLSL